jgi:hypothetical protein
VRSSLRKTFNPEETLREYARLLTPALDLSASKD